MTDPRMVGADVDALVDLASAMRGASSFLTQRGDELTARMRSLEWHGPAAADMRSRWFGYQAPVMADVAELLRRQADALNAQARQQVEASAGMGLGRAPAAGLGPGVVSPFQCVPSEADGGSLLLEMFQAGNVAFTTAETTMTARELTQYATGTRAVLELTGWMPFAGLVLNGASLGFDLAPGFGSGEFDASKVDWTSTALDAAGVAVGAAPFVLLALGVPVLPAVAVGLATAGIIIGGAQIGKYAWDHREQIGAGLSKAGAFVRDSLVADAKRKTAFVRSAVKAGSVLIREGALKVDAAIHAAAETVSAVADAASRTVDGVTGWLDGLLGAVTPAYAAGAA